MNCCCLRCSEAALRLLPLVAAVSCWEAAVSGGRRTSLPEEGEHETSLFWQSSAQRRLTETSWYVNSLWAPHSQAIFCCCGFGGESDSLTQPTAADCSITSSGGRGALESGSSAEQKEEEEKRVSSWPGAKRGHGQVSVAQMEGKNTHIKVWRDTRRNK